MAVIIRTSVLLWWSPRIAELSSVRGVYRGIEIEHYLVPWTVVSTALASGTEVVHFDSQEYLGDIQEGDGRMEGLGRKESGRRSVKQG